MVYPLWDMFSGNSLFKLLFLGAIGCAAAVPAVGGTIIIGNNFVAGASPLNEVFNRGWMAVGFTMQSDSDFTGAVIDIGTSGPPTGDAFSVSLWSDSAGSPGTDLLALNNSAASGLINLTPASSFTLNAGSSYWILVVSNKKSLTWLQGDAEPAGAGATWLGFEQSSGGNSTPGANPTAGSTAAFPYFEVDGPAAATSPEPGSLMLLSGAAALTFFIRRRG
jgi:hypothetical protein